jgi:23S rRNA pseudouridine955/2504/2580 synthase
MRPTGYVCGDDAAHSADPIAERPQNEVDEAAKQRVDLPILYEDEAMLVIDKPEGIAVHGGSGVSFGVIEALRRQRPQAKFLELAHRLDRETSGVLLVGKKRLALTALHDMFREHGAGADKRYLVLVKGRWMNTTQHVKLPLHKYLTESGERRVSVNPEGKASHTVFRLLARWPEMSLLEAQLKTGRTHQIRVHLAHLGFPILGDEKYGDFAAEQESQARRPETYGVACVANGFSASADGGAVGMHCPRTGWHY